MLKKLVETLKQFFNWARGKEQKVYAEVEGWPEEWEEVKRGVWRYTVQQRIKDARRRRRHLKPSSKHFPPAPAFEKRHWDKNKKMEDE